MPEIVKEILNAWGLSDEDRVRFLRMVDKGANQTHVSTILADYSAVMGAMLALEIDLGLGKTS
jgi:hypothetical protein